MRVMWKERVCLPLVLLLVVGCDTTAEPEPDRGAELREVEGTLRSETHVFEEVADGVYFATGAGTVNVASNALVVVNEEDVLVVDSHITADAARELVRSVGALTDKPIRFLVNSHFHFDHAHGNQAFPAGIQILAHEYTREKLLQDVFSEPTYRVIGSREAQERLLEGLEAQLAEAGEEESHSALEAQIAMLERHITALGEVEPTPPNVTLVRKLTLYRGSREIQLHHLGRGHTAGDVVVYLPAERVLFTGDLLYPGAPYLGDAFADEFPETLERLKEFEVDVIAGGHGPLMRDPSVIDRAQEYLREYWSQVAAFHERGLSVEEAVEELDLSEWEDFATFQLSQPGVLELEVRRMYERLDEKGSSG